MGYFYIDDSIHDVPGFILAACVYSHKNLQTEINLLYKQLNLSNAQFEFKSSINFSKFPEYNSIREALKSFINERCRLGLVILPRSKRELLGEECMKALKKFILHNRQIRQPLTICFDEGIFSSRKMAEKYISEPEFKTTELHLICDSRSVSGIQVADLAAHIASIQLKGAYGLVNKMVKVLNDNVEETELTFEMFATIRYTFFNRGLTIYTDDPIKDATVDVEPFGLYVSEYCDETLAEKARTVFGSVYLGCIH